MKIAEEKLKERKDVAAAAGPGGAAAAAAAAAGAPVQEDEDAPAEDFAADDSQSLAQLVERAVNGELKTASRRPDRVAESRSLAEGHVIHETAAFGHLAGLPVNYRWAAEQSWLGACVLYNCEHHKQQKMGRELSYCKSSGTCLHKTNADSWHHASNIVVCKAANWFHDAHVACGVCRVLCRFMGRSQALVLGMQPSPMAGICSKAVPNNISESLILSIYHHNRAAGLS